ncbi:WXG100 family type VII secretion target [Streptomyces sp. NPDC021020]|uniref:WXG100 family type VII secretion target n=1 Tax=Streptomyces sp. NPDC021020 TaxID=3365109 RepID=UPI0037AC12D8
MTARQDFSANAPATAPGRADFETSTHEQLLAMIRHADPEAIASVGDHLGLAVEVIARIGADLDRHIALVDWEGTSGAAFREWGRHVARATLGLSDYAHATANALTHAADTLRAVKRDMPPVPAAARVAYATLRDDPTIRHDPDAQTQMARAHTELETARIEAADQMRKLAQSYSLSATVIGTAEPPEFPPMPSPFVPPSQTRRTDVLRGDAVTSPAVPAPVRSSPETGTGGEAMRDIAAASGSPPAAVPDSAGMPLTRTQSAGAPALVVQAQSGPQPNGNGGGAFVGVPHPGNASLPFMSGALARDHSRDAGAPGKPAQLPRNVARQVLPKVSYEPGSRPLPAPGGRNHGIVGGSPAGEPPTSGIPGQPPAASGVVGEPGSALRPPAVGMVGRTPVAEFAPRISGSASGKGEDSDRPRYPAEFAGEWDWGPGRDDAVPPVIR